MRFPFRLSGRRRVIALAGASALVVSGMVAVSATNAYAATACEVVYTTSDWTETPSSGGFTANVVIKNVGDPLPNWTLTFAFPAGQNSLQGWSANWSQSGANVTATNMPWNGLAAGGETSIGFNAKWTGSNPAPTEFRINGTLCNGSGPVNQAPTVALSSPAEGASFAQGTAVALSATASDPDGSISKVEFLVDGVVVNSDTTSPYGFDATGLAVGQHTWTAVAYDDGNPALTATATARTFTVTGTTTPAIQVTPASLSLAGGTNGTATFRLNQAPSGNVTATLTRTGSTVITFSPTTITFTTSNWQSGVPVTVTAAAGTTAATATITAAATGYTSAQLSVTRTGQDDGEARQDNPYVGATVYVNPQWRANALAEPGGSRIANQPTGVWFDRISAIYGNNSPTTGSMGLVEHLDEAVAQDAANGASRLVFQMVVYNLPGRDCSALASNGELGPTELPKYKAEYIDPIAEILARPAYRNLRIVAIIEIDSLPNLVTNVSGRPTAVPECDTMLANNGYVDGVGYALAKLGAVANVYNYVDAGHHGWLGWDDNFGASAQKLFQAANRSGATPADVHGFITNTANTSALQEPYIDINGSVGGQQVRQSAWVDWNRYNDELSFAQAFRTRLVSEGFNANIGMLIDTSRNGWGGAARPTGPGTSTDLNTFINQSRIDRRIHKGNWCNPSGAGLGERPQTAPAAGIDAYVWIKPPGESDGSSTLIPNDEGKGFDRMCDPTYGGNVRNGNSMTGALPNAPVAGHWFSAQFQELMQNAYPPLP